MLDLKALLSKILNNLTCDLIYNGSFTTGNISLTHSIANYKSLLFVYRDNDGARHTKRIVTNNARSISVILDVVRVSGAAYLKTMLADINGTTMQSGFNRQWASNTPQQGYYVILEKIYGCTSVAVGGGYLTSKFSNIFSHLERWWEHVRFEGFTCEDINSLVWFGYVYWLLSTRKFQCNDARWWLNKLYQIARRSLYGLLHSRCKNNTSTNKFGCSKNSDKQARVGVHQSILFYIKCRWFIQIFIRKQRRVLAKCGRRLECKHRLSCWWRGANVRHRGFHIIPRSNGGGYEQCWI